MRRSLSNIEFGGSVLIIKNGRTYLNYATVDKTNTSYLTSSVQKFITRTTIMKAVQEGKLSLSGTLAKFCFTVPGANKVAVLSLLQITSGLSTDKASGTKPFVNGEKNLKYTIKNIKFDENILREVLYSTLDYIFLSNILSNIYSTFYEKLITRSLINELKLKHTTFSWANNKTLKEVNFVLGHQLSSNGKYITQKLDLGGIHSGLDAESSLMDNYDLSEYIKYILTCNYLSKSNMKAPYGMSNLTNTGYGGSFYIHNTYSASSGGDNDYYIFLRTSNNAETIVIVQTDRARGNFFELRSVMGQLIIALQE